MNHDDANMMNHTDSDHGLRTSSTSPTRPPGGGMAMVDEASLPYEEARRRAVSEFERRYVEAILRRHGGRVSVAARAAGIDRRYLYRLVRRHSVRH